MFLPANLSRSQEMPKQQLPAFQRAMAQKMDGECDRK